MLTKQDDIYLGWLHNQIIKYVMFLRNKKEQFHDSIIL